MRTCGAGWMRWPPTIILNGIGSEAMPVILKTNALMLWHEPGSNSRAGWVKSSAGRDQVACDAQATGPVVTT